jgi:hypothetical protein
MQLQHTYRQFIFVKADDGSGDSLIKINDIDSLHAVPDLPKLAAQCVGNNQMQRRVERKEDMKGERAFLGPQTWSFEDGHGFYTTKYDVFRVGSIVRNILIDLPLPVDLSAADAAIVTQRRKRVTEILVAQTDSENPELRSSMVSLQRAIAEV